MKYVWKLYNQLKEGVLDSWLEVEAWSEAFKCLITLKRQIQIICDVICTTIDIYLYEHEGNVSYIQPIWHSKYTGHASTPVYHLHWSNCCHVAILIGKTPVFNRTYVIACQTLCASNDPTRSFPFLYSNKLSWLALCITKLKLVACSVPRSELIE